MGSFFFRRKFPSALRNGLAEYELNLSVHTAEIVLRPSLNRFPKITVYSKQVFLLTRHNLSRVRLFRGVLVIKRSRVDHGVRLAFAAQYHEQVAHHGGFSLFVEIKHLPLG